MYLSGPPLHVITVALVERFRVAPGAAVLLRRRRRPPQLRGLVALGVAPVPSAATCSSRAATSRLPQYLEDLEATDAGARARTVVISWWRPATAGGGRGRAAPPALPRRSLRPPRIGRRLALFDCVNCDKCLPACPNDANFVYEVEPISGDFGATASRAAGAVPVAGERLEVRERHQIATFQDFCNDCGNCDTFCPEDGGPYLEKPRFFGSLAAWRQQAGRDGFCVRRARTLTRCGDALAASSTGSR